MSPITPGRVLLALLLMVCFVPAYSMAIIFPMTFVFGKIEPLFRIQVILVYVASAATAIWLVTKMPKPYKPPKEDDKSPSSD